MFSSSETTKWRETYNSVTRKEKKDKAESGTAIRSGGGKKGQKNDSTKGCMQEEDQKGSPDDMSCAGIFGSGYTKTVVMEHHKTNESRFSPIHHGISKPVAYPIDVSSAMQAKSG